MDEVCGARISHFRRHAPSLIGCTWCLIGHPGQPAQKKGYLNVQDNLFAQELYFLVPQSNVKPSSNSFLCLDDNNSRKTNQLKVLTHITYTPMAETAVSSCLLDLYPELQLEITQYIQLTPGWQIDLLNWSSTCSKFRSFLAPYIFSSITLRNTEKSGASVDLLAKSSYRQFVRRLSFEGTAWGDMEDVFYDTEGILPAIVESVISDLSQFPNLQTVSIKFDIDFHYGFDISFRLFREPELPEEMVKAEGEEAWRVLNTKVHAALARNVNPSFKKLELNSLLPAEASSFRTPEFRRLLGQMTHFTLYCWRDEEELYALRTRPGYLTYVGKFHEIFFNHLTSVTHLSISADFTSMAIFGPRGYYSTFDISSRMPLLKDLRVDSVFIGADLVSFLTNNDTLEAIRFQNCTSGESENYINIRIPWKDLFMALSDKKPTKLREFSVSPSHCFDPFDPPEAMGDEIELVLEYLRTHPERRPFQYSQIDDKYGYVLDAGSENLESFWLGDDQRAYDELMRIVERNSERSKN